MNNYMTYFHMQLDDKFKELMIKVKKNKMDIKDLIELKSFIFDVYENESKIDDIDIRNGFRMLEIEPRFNYR